MSKATLPPETFRCTIHTPIGWNRRLLLIALAAPLCWWSQHRISPFVFACGRKGRGDSLVALPVEGMVGLVGYFLTRVIRRGEEGEKVVAKGLKAVVDVLVRANEESQAMVFQPPSH